MDWLKKYQRFTLQRVLNKFHVWEKNVPQLKLRVILELESKKTSKDFTNSLIHNL